MSQKWRHRKCDNLISISIHISVKHHNKMSLYLLARSGNTTDLRARMEAGEDVNQADMSGWTALHGACCGGVSDDVLGLLLSYKPMLDERNHRDGCLTALHVACVSNRLEAVQRLVTAGASLEVKNDGGDTPLHLAAVFASSDVVDVLLQAGACVDAVAKYGHTPLHYACVKTNIPVVQALLSHGADVNIRDKFGATPLLSMLTVSGKPASSILTVIQLLCDQGTDVNARDNEGCTPLLELLLRDLTESFILPIVQQLINLGAVPYLCDKTGRNAVTEAERTGCVAVLEAFKQRKFIYECHR